MCTEIIPKATKKSRLDRITHHNIHMVLKIKEEDRGAYVYEARKAYRKCRNKKAGLFQICWCFRHHSMTKKVAIQPCLSL